MKYKADFVTNSSSSSFVMVGFRLTGDYNNIEKEILSIFNEKDYNALYKNHGISIDEINDNIIIGQYSRFEECDEYCEYGFDIEKIKYLASKIGKTEKDIKIMFGTRST